VSSRVSISMDLNASQKISLQDLYPRLYPLRTSFHLGKGRWGVGLKMSTSMDLDLTEPAPLVSRACDGTAEAEMMVLIS
jgi:hypothetical protein